MLKTNGNLQPRRSLDGIIALAIIALIRLHQKQLAELVAAAERMPSIRDPETDQECFSYEGMWDEWKRLGLLPSDLPYVQ